MKTEPIGIFDSGIGGITIWKAINQLLPSENTIYLADSKNAPYGQKSKDEIIDLCFKNVRYLIAQNSKIIVVACNTATTNAIKEMRQTFDIPFIGIEPAIKPAALNSATQVIGVLATQGTINSALFHESIAKFQNTKFIEQIGFGLVQLIEAGKIDSQEMKDLLTNYLQPMIDSNIDYLVLGCSHYPFLIKQIKAILPSHIKIIDSGEAVAKQTKNVLNQLNQLNDSQEKKSNQFYINANSDVLKNILDNKYNVEELIF